MGGKFKARPKVNGPLRSRVFAYCGSLHWVWEDQHRFLAAIAALGNEFWSAAGYHMYSSTEHPAALAGSGWSCLSGVHPLAMRYTRAGTRPNIPAWRW